MGTRQTWPLGMVSFVQQVKWTADCTRRHRLRQQPVKSLETREPRWRRALSRSAPTTPELDGPPPLHDAEQPCRRTAAGDDFILSQSDIPAWSLFPRHPRTVSLGQQAMLDVNGRPPYSPASLMASSKPGLLTGDAKPIMAGDVFKHPVSASLPRTARGSTNQSRRQKLLIASTEWLSTMTQLPPHPLPAAKGRPARPEAASHASKRPLPFRVNDSAGT